MLRSGSLRDLRHPCLLRLGLPLFLLPLGLPVHIFQLLLCLLAHPGSQLPARFQAAELAGDCLAGEAFIEFGLGDGLVGLLQELALVVVVNLGGS